MPSISVVIPCFNRAHTLRRALDSVLAQTVLPDEIIVVDDGSSDGTGDIIKAHYPYVTLLSQENKGVSVARNAGIQQSQNDWIALLDSDDEWHPQKIEKQSESILQHENAVLVHTDEIWIRNGVRVNPMKKHRKSGGHIFQNCLPLCCISPSSVLIHRQVLDEIGRFDESLPACEDYDLWLRLCARHAVDYIDEPLLTKYGGHMDQLSKRYPHLDRFRIRAIQKVLESGTLNNADEQAAVSMLIHKLEIYLHGARKHQNQDNIEEFKQLLSRYQDHTMRMSTEHT